jgi:4-aminobutyrate aminotransferase / (S)-3-amino-2-methylpropionate transaminase / 5-aminovalerate transaminase
MPTNGELLHRRQNAVPLPLLSATPLFCSRARNAELWDVEGRRYVDFAAGIAVVNTGHCHPRVLAAVREQLERFTHTSFQVMMYESYVELAERLNAIAPLEGEAKTVFFTTGAEAVENAIKISRGHTGRSGIIAFTGAFHGRTALACGLTGKVVPYKRGLGPTMPDIWHAPFPTLSNGVTVDETLRHLDFIFRADIDPSNVAAVIIEPVQGEGGFHQAPAELLRAVRRLCDEHGIVLIADEIQTGFGRTGRMFAFEHYDVKPDLICVAKSLAGGFPLSGVIGRRSVMDSIEAGGIGSTYAGNPIAVAAALAVLDVIRDERLLERAETIGAQLKGQIDTFSRRNDLIRIAHVRGVGAMVGFDVVKDSAGRVPDPDSTKMIVRRAFESGLILLSCGTEASTIRLLAPLTASDETIGEGLVLLERALAADGFAR